MVERAAGSEESIRRFSPGEDEKDDTCIPPPPTPACHTHTGKATRHHKSAPSLHMDPVLFRAFSAEYTDMCVLCGPD
jgi:hypothetical protein